MLILKKQIKTQTKQNQKYKPTKKYCNQKTHRGKPAERQSTSLNIAYFIFYLEERTLNASWVHLLK